MTGWKVRGIPKTACALALLLAAPSAIARTDAENAPDIQSGVGEEGPRLMSPNLRVSDLERSSEFYQHVLGMIELGRVELPHLTEIMLGFSRDATRAGILIFKRKGEVESPPIEHGSGYARSVIRVPDLQTVIDGLQAAGGQPGKMFSHGPYHIMMLTDPDGYQFEVVAKTKEDTGHNHD